MKNTTLLLLSIFITFSSVAQSKKKCECIQTPYETGKETEVFDFSGGKKIMLCGSVNSENDETRYFEFVLFVCGKQTAIDFWDASKVSEVNKVADTLYVNQFVELPVGENFEVEQVAWKVDKIFFLDEQVSIRNSLNRNIQKYDDSQIAEVKKLYNLAKPAAVDSKKMQLATKLLMAAISGDESARTNLTDFKEKYQVAGMPEEVQYNQLIAKLAEWDN